MLTNVDRENAQNFFPSTKIKILEVWYREMTSQVIQYHSAHL